MSKSTKNKKALELAKPRKTVAKKKVPAKAKAPELMKGFTMEDDVPIPMRRSHNESIYPLKEMAIGKSFFVEAEKLSGEYSDPLEAQKARKEELNRLYRRLVSAVSTVRKRNSEAKFVVRIVDNGVRVWRLAPDLD